LREAIDGVLDVAAFNREVGQEKQDAARAEGWRRAMQSAIGGLALGDADGEKRP
jgi:hypothetical protein